MSLPPDPCHAPPLVCALLNVNLELGEDSESTNVYAPAAKADTSRILIVDDSPTQQHALTGLLEGQDYEFSFANDGKTALSKAVQEKPDLVLIDVVLPGMDGFEVCRRMRQEPSLAEIPVVFTTFLDDQSTRLRALEAGADDILTKPLNELETQSRVRAITRLNRYRKLHNVVERHERLLQMAPMGVVVVDERGRVTFANKAANHILGVGPLDSLLQRPISSLVAPESTEPTPGWLSRLSDEQPCRFETMMMRLDRQRTPVEIGAIPVQGDTGRETVIVISDISQRKEMELQLHRRALYDHLTGLPNRNLFLDRLTQTRGLPSGDGFDGVGLLLVDLDYFRQFNDSLGELAGDQLLRACSLRLMDAMAPADTVARLGEDTFAILASRRINKDELAQMAEKVLSIFRFPFDIGKSPSMLGASCGTALGTIN
ncbi:MAG: diguanylate cyclase, partial [Proteobacteria bacterium]|nr:diguanylate cyclase [Pseudomonadota bacterium]